MTPIDLDRLLADTAFVRRIARSLVRDPDAAEDLAQDALVVALERPPREGTSLRGWIATVVRSLAIDRARSSDARARRESAVVARGNAPGADEIAERLDLSQHVARALRELDEPYRTALYLRYVEELDPSDIADRLGLPVATVKTHLRRGLEILRVRFDREWGERATWSALFMPLALDSTTKATITGTIWMSALTKAAAVLCVCAAAWMFWPSAPSVAWIEGPSLQMDAAGNIRAVDADEHPRSAVIGLDTSREVAVVADRSTSSGGPFVRVLDERRFPVEGAHVVLHVPGFGDDESTTNALGIARFSTLPDLEKVDRTGSLIGWDDRARAAARAIHVRAIDAAASASEIESLRNLGDVVLAPSASLTVRVEEKGLAVPNARVRLSVGASRVPIFDVTADDRGRARFEHVPARTIVASAGLEGRTGRSIEVLAPARDTEIVVVLQPTRTIDVTVIDAETKAPIAGARVSLAEGYNVTDDEGDSGMGLGQTGFMAKPLDIEVLPTDADGRTRVVGLPAQGNHQISAKAELFAGPRPPASPPWIPSRSDAITLELRSLHERTARWPLERGEIDAPPNGTALVLRSETVRDLPIDFYSAQPLRARIEDGAIVADRVLDGVETTFAIAPDGSIAKLWIRSGGLEGRPTSFRRPRHIDVTVLEADGRPAKDLELEVRNGGNNRLLPRVKTDAQGRAVFERLWGGEVSVNTREAELATVDVESGDARVEVRLDARRSNSREVSIRLHVDGSPRLPPRYDIRIGDAAEFRSEDPATGIVRMTYDGRTPEPSVWATAPGFLSTTVRFDANSTDVVDVDLQRAGALLARVVPPRSGSVRLRAEAWDPVKERWQTGSAHQVRDERYSPNAPDGAYLYEGLETGRYRVRDLGSDRASDAVDVVAGANASVVELDLSNIVLVRGVIERPVDRSPWYARVVVEGEGFAVHEANFMKGSETPEGHYADKDGRFSVLVDVTQPVMLRVAHPYLSPDPKDGSVVVRGEMQDVRLKLVEGDEVQIPLTAFPNGASRHSLRVYAYAGEPIGEPHAWFHALVIDGVARFSGLEHGKWTLWIDPDDATAPIVVRDVVVADGITLVTTAPVKGSSLRVRILHAEETETPLVRATVRMRVEPTLVRGSSSREATDDFVVVTGIGAGAHEVVITAGERSPILRTITFDGHTDVEIDFDTR